MSDPSQPEFGAPGSADGPAPVTSRLSRRSLRERAAQLEAEKAGADEVIVATGPVVAVIAESPGLVSPPVGRSERVRGARSTSMSPTPAGSDLDTPPTVVPLSTPAVPPSSISVPTHPAPVVPAPVAPNPANPVPVSRVVRRSASQMAPKLTQPPTPAAIPTRHIARAEQELEANPVQTELQREAKPGLITPVSTVEREPHPITNSDLVSVPAPLRPGVPPWDAITTGAGPDGEIVPVAVPSRSERHALRSDEAARVAPPSAGYTWVQYLILIAVAFVLGLLLWQLIIGELHVPHLGGSAMAAGGVGFRFLEIRL